MVYLYIINNMNITNIMNVKAIQLYNNQIFSERMQ